MLVSAFSLPVECALYSSLVCPILCQPWSPPRAEFPKIEGAEIAATTYGKRVAGDFYDSLRVSPERVLFGLLDVAGRRENNQIILSAAQNMFRTLGAELFSRPDFNESDAMTELCLHLNRGLMEAADGRLLVPGIHRLLPRKIRHPLLHQRRTHSGTAPATVPALSNSHPPVCRSACSPTPPATLPPLAWRKVRFFLLVSRGVVEGKCKDDKAEDREFGLERVKERLQADTSQSAQALCASILNAVGEFTCEPLVPDDMTRPGVCAGRLTEHRCNLANRQRIKT